LIRRQLAQIRLALLAASRVNTPNMRIFIPLLLLALSSIVVAQQPDVPVPAQKSQKEAPKTPDELQQAAWKMSREQYALVHPSRRPGGEMYKFHRPFKRGPHGNLLERLAGGPMRPVSL
jgi:hypothetical protein